MILLDREDKDMSNKIIESPDYLQALVIYEIATKGFTSPDGPESGTFVSTAEKLPYLKELGVNAIWLTGHQWCDASHFYNIWTEYACIRPDVLDPTLGTEKEFKDLIDKAHDNGIRVFLDVITHGVMENSPLVAEHPNWFSGGSWGMRDFDWYGGHEDLDAWWVNTWVRYIEEFGVDGYRLDVAHYRNDLWALIRKKAAENGKEIVIVAETGPAIRGVTDILQHGEAISHNYGLNSSFRMLTDVAGYCKDRISRKNERYEVKIEYTDGTVQDSRVDRWYQDEKTLDVILEENVVKSVICEKTGIAYEIQNGHLRVENIYEEKEIKNIQISNREAQKWNSNMDGVLEIDYTITYSRIANGLLLEFPLRIQKGQYLSVQLCCHDNGWVGFPENKKSYVTEESRYLMGYVAMLAPAIPVMMAGEEFSSEYRPLPKLTPGLYGEGVPGTGHWLYGSWIDWSQLEQQSKKQMLEDTRQILSIRKKYKELIKPAKMEEKDSNFYSISYHADSLLPVPYCYVNDKEMLIIAANPDSNADANVSFDLSTFISKHESCQVDILFGEAMNGQMSIKSAGDMLSDFSWKIRKDKVSQGGLLVLHIQILNDK